MKECPVCKKMKDNSGFSKSKREKDGLQWKCRQCEKDYYQIVKSRRSEQNKTYYRNSREQRLEKHERWRQANKEKLRVKWREYYARTILRRREYDAEHRKRNIEKHRNYQRRHYQENKEKYRIKSEKWRALVVAAEGDGVTKEQWEVIKRGQSHTCLSCHRSEPEIKLTMDHIVPLSRGGNHDISNIQGLCKACNSSKHDKIIDYRTGMNTVTI